jgi:hypothetical protein
MQMTKDELLSALQSVSPLAGGLAKMAVGGDSGPVEPEPDVMETEGGGLSVLFTLTTYPKPLEPADSDGSEPAPPCALKGQRVVELATPSK